MRGPNLAFRALVGAIAATLGTTGVNAGPDRAERGASGGSDAGVGSSAALNNPDCDAETGRIKFPTLAAPQCVKPWKNDADNGGATAQGVTKDAIKVVVLYAD